MSPESISSTTNPRVKHVRALQGSRGEREEAGQFVIEGPTLLREALAAGCPIDEVYLTKAFLVDPDHAILLGALRATGVSMQPVSEAVFGHMTDTRTPQGILAVLPLVHLPVPEKPSFILILDSVRDPGNLGTILRLAAGAAVPLVLLAPGAVDLYNPKVVRAAMGAHFVTPALTASWDEIAVWCGSCPVYVADSGGGAAHFRVNWTQPCALIVSDEAHGPGPDALRLARHAVMIPMPGKTESLNVAMATGILIYELVRQRSEAGQYGELPS